MGLKGKRYSPKVVLEALKSEKSDVDVARAFEVHPATVSRWKKQFVDEGPEVFGGSEQVKEYEERIGQLKRRGLRGSSPLLGPLAAMPRS